MRITLRLVEGDAIVVDVDRSELVGAALQHHLSCYHRKKWNDHLPFIWESVAATETASSDPSETPGQLASNSKELLCDASLRAARQATMRVKILEALLGDEKLDLQASWGQQGVEDEAVVSVVVDFAAGKFPIASTGATSPTRPPHDGRRPSPRRVTGLHLQPRRLTDKAERAKHRAASGHGRQLRNIQVMSSRRRQERLLVAAAVGQYRRAERIEN